MLLGAAESALKFSILFVSIGVGICQDDSHDGNRHRTGKPAAFTGRSPTGPQPTSDFAAPRWSLSEFHLTSCVTPPEPANGVYKVYPYDFQIPEGDLIATGDTLEYACDQGYKLSGNPLVTCQENRNLSPIPFCDEIKCNALNSSSTVSRCFRHGRWVSCESSVLPGTRARISCRPDYLQEMSATRGQKGTTECDAEGKWVPEPIVCRPACGLATSETAMDYPWRASIHLKREDLDYVNYECGATILRDDLVLTAASCVYDEKTKSALDPRKLFVITGNEYNDYHYSQHDPQLVEKSAVKSVHVNCDYRGKSSEGDIALVELEDPFEFTQLRLPACLSDAARVELEPNAYGSLAEFGSLTQGGRPLPDTDDLPIVKTQPYVPHERCKDSGKLRNRNALTKDKFCAGFSNRTSECVVSRGGGLVFKNHNLWYVTGVVSVATDVIITRTGSLECENYAIYTNVSEYTAWIADVIFHLKLNKSYPSCQDSGSSLSKNGKPDVDPNISNDGGPSCPAPPQPKNGAWMVHPSLCTNDEDCKILRGSPLKPGTLLIYECSPGFMAKEGKEIYCGFSGDWSAIPVCSEIKCDSLSSVSTEASCYDRFGKWISCDPNVPPGTRAEVSCHLGYRKDTAFSTFRRETVRCGENGKWMPDPIKCVAVCGVATTHQTPLIINGTAAELSDFPWHATLYLERNSSTGVKKDFICGATIIHTNFLLTAAHCVYDERTQSTTKPTKLFAVTGNIFRDYDFPFHNSVSVKKVAVRGVYRPCKYYGLRGNYASDIALLELESPFVFSGVLLPACLDVEGYDKQILEPGAWGRVAGFGRTATGATSGALQTLTLPYVSYNQCKTSRNAEKNDVLISSDKFCAGYTNGSAVCEGDSGGGLVFQKGELWYVLGIVSVGLGVDLDNGEKTCDKYSYSLYTKVSEHMTWIQDVMFQRAQLNIYPLCDENV